MKKVLVNNELQTLNPAPIQRGLVLYRLLKTLQLACLPVCPRVGGVNNERASNISGSCDLNLKALEELANALVVLSLTAEDGEIEVRISVVLVMTASALVSVWAQQPMERQYLPPVGSYQGRYQGSTLHPNLYNTLVSADRFRSSRFETDGAGGLGPRYFIPRESHGESYRRYGTQEDSLAEEANYEFSYQVLDGPSGNEFGHQESRTGEVTRGSYHVLLPDGRLQVVEYEADGQGYRPTVRYEGSNRGGFPGSRRGLVPN
uniref:Pro-resilin n=1 Tax=Timema shepardi TaxID=629360 RepID=A0A7R9ATD3_TIMSH|nr:unnamed protein product [Timema shepardi]